MCYPCLVVFILEIIAYIFGGLLLFFFSTNLFLKNYRCLYISSIAACVLKKCFNSILAYGVLFFFFEVMLPSWAIFSSIIKWVWLHCTELCKLVKNNETQKIIVINLWIMIQPEKKWCTFGSSSTSSSTLVPERALCYSYRPSETVIFPSTLTFKSPLYINFSLNLPAFVILCTWWVYGHYTFTMFTYTFTYLPVYAEAYLWCPVTSVISMDFKFSTQQIWQVCPWNPLIMCDEFIQRL